MVGILESRKNKKEKYCCLRHFDAKENKNSLVLFVRMLISFPRTLANAAAVPPLKCSDSKKLRINYLNKFFIQYLTKSWKMPVGRVGGYLGPPPPDKKLLRRLEVVIGLRIS